jgi:hypothetical protein
VTTLRKELFASVAALDLVIERLGRVDAGVDRDMLNTARDRLRAESLKLTAIAHELELIRMVPLLTEMH